MTVTDVSTEKAHASLGASKAHRWMVCPGSLKLEEPFPNTSSEYADEGTAAHELMEWCLTTGQDAIAYAGRIITVERSGRKFEVDAEMVDNVQAYVDYVRALGGQLIVEQKVDFGRYLEQPDAFGTADTIVIRDNELVVVDLKYGKGVKVDAFENPQLMLYALGALDIAMLVEDIETVTIVIHQPRIEGGVSEWTTTVEQLEAFGLEARVAARHAVHQLNDGAPPKLVPGPKQCGFCKAKSVCPAYLGETTGVAKQAASVDDFDDLTQERIVEGLAATDAPTLSQMMAKIDLLEALPKAIRAEVERRLVADTPVPGFKLVEGKRGNRAWINPDEAEVVLKGMRLKIEQMYDLKLISPTAAEKLAKAGDLGPRQWAKLQKEIGQSAGKPSVAPESDKRPAISVAASADDFAVIADDGSDLA